MYYETKLTIPKNTPASAPVEAEILIHPGVIQQVQVSFPPGPAGLAHVQIFYWERQIWPSNPDSDFSGDAIVITFSEDLCIPDPPYVIMVRGWNEDDSYLHTVTVRMQLSPFEAALHNAQERVLLGAAGPVTYIQE